MELAEDLRLAIEEAEWPLRKVTASFGIATTTTSNVEAHSLISSADLALYASKKNGRNQVCG